MAWFVYLARCADDSLYCGIARDVVERIAEHDAGRGAKYTRGRGPLVVLITRRCRTHGNALRLEHAIKQLARKEKAALAGDPARLNAIATRVLATARATARARDRRARRADGARASRGA